MKIKVLDHEGTNIRLSFPSGLLLNRITAIGAARWLRRYGLKMTGRQIMAVIQTMRDYKHRHRDWTLVEVRSADGDYITVRF